MSAAPVVYIIYSHVVARSPGSSFSDTCTLPTMDRALQNSWSQSTAKVLDVFSGAAGVRFEELQRRSPQKISSSTDNGLVDSFESFTR
jgi:hypothetical protein